MAVLGAGTMGSQIAAHAANAGARVLLLDVTEAAARGGLERARGLKPDPFFSPDAVRLVRTGGFDRDLEQLGAADWIVEAVIEQLEAKRRLAERVEAVRRPGSIVSSNTSGIRLASIAEGRSVDFRRHWLGTHFFNPPRYLHLLELVPTADTDPEVVDRLARFADLSLGKGVVVAKDAPGFIANRIGLLGLMEAIRALETGEYTVEEIDAMTGPAIGRPKSATFRTADIVGLDVIGHVADSLAGQFADESERLAFRLPPLASDLIARGWIGEKAGRGFYRRDGSEILALDPATMSYRPRQAVRLPALEAAASIGDPGARLRALFLGRDRVGAFLRRSLGATLLHAARVAPEIAHSIDDVDRAMRWGYGWELGPFETWDAIGIRDVLDATEAAAPPLAADRLKSGRNTFRDGRLPPAGAGLQLLASARERRRIVRENPGASLLDLGDGVLAVEFHSKMNTIGGDAVEMLHAGLAEAAANHQALVIGSEAPDFSAGANLLLLLLEAQEGHWDEIDRMVRAFQAATQAVRYAEIPVIACPAGLTLGGACEIALHSDRLQAAAEAYIGLVETGVGLIPAGGGTKEMLARSVEGQRLSPQADLLSLVQPAFETIAFARVSSSADDARRLGYLRPTDVVTMNRDRLIADAKALALERVREGYRTPLPPSGIAVGGESLRAALQLGIHLARRAGRITDHDAVVAGALAHVMAGGSLPHAAAVGEPYLLDLEREAFLRLVGEPKTLDRIRHTLKTGKPLRN